MHVDCRIALLCGVLVHDLQDRYTCTTTPGEGDSSVEGTSTKDCLVHLKGWHKPLPVWVVQAIASGQLVIWEEKGIEYLKGQVQSPHGYVVEFQ